MEKNDKEKPRLNKADNCRYEISIDSVQFYPLYYQRAYAHIKGLSAYNIIVYLRMNGKDMDPVGSCVVWSRPLMFAYVPKTPCVIAQFI